MYTKLIHTFLSLLPNSSYILLWQEEWSGYDDKQLELVIVYNKTVCLKTSPIEIEPEKFLAQISPQKF